MVRSGVHHYQPLEHGLVALRQPEEVADPGPGAAFVLSGIPFRTCWKYGERGWRHLWWDASTILANRWPWPPPTEWRRGSRPASTTTR